MSEILHNHFPTVFRKNCKRCILNKAAPGLLTACKNMQWLYDQRALGPLEAAAQYGPDYRPPTDKDCIEIRTKLETAIKQAESRN